MVLLPLSTQEYNEMFVNGLENLKKLLAMGNLGWTHIHPPIHG